MLSKIINFLSESTYDYSIEIDNDCYKSRILLNTFNTIYKFNMIHVDDLNNIYADYYIVCTNYDCSLCH